MPLLKLNELFVRANQKPGSRLVVAAAEDKAVLLAIREAMLRFTISPVLVGNSDKIRSLMDEIKLEPTGFTLIDSISVEDSAVKAVKVIHDGGGEILMKGIFKQAYS